ncbi:AraC family transcriptional regulator [Butyrivibrio sp. MC2013]|uniref:AraC family transcriptional regulator n=1 Tax=Butyrivibrio sp. MC2013 TaxID=1280686 RepID=UPI0004111A26|nr:AraC family transcriptional regulator [Butyrivibrio sp. MC2013]
MKKNLQTTFSTRQYMLSKDFEIYYYSDRDLQNVRYHAHDYYEFYFFLEGNVEMEVGGAKVRLTPGDMILIPPHQKHRLSVISAPDNKGQTTVSPYRRFVFWISKDYLTDLMKLSGSYGYVMQQASIKKKYIYHFDIFTFNELRSRIFSLIEELRSDRFGRDARSCLLVNDLVFSINRYVYELDHPNSPKEEHSLYQNLLSYIEEHIDEDISLDALAAACYASKFHIAHIFKDNLGISVHQYILKKRLSLSRDAIMSGTEITKAYLMCGFKDYSAFFKAFKKEYGMSPKEYRDIYTMNME